MRDNLSKKGLAIGIVALLFLIGFGSVVNAINIGNNQEIDTSVCMGVFTNLDDYTEITVEEAWILLNDTSNGIQIPIDVRTDVEWANEHIDTPSPENPKHHCVCEWDNETIVQDFMSLYAGKTIILYCLSGGRSTTAANILVDGGFTGTIYNMLGGITAWRNAGFPTICNQPPDTPTITGTINGKPETEYPYTISSTDPEGDDVYYYINWSDGTDTMYIGPYSSGEEVIVNHIWAEKGTYVVKVKAWDYYQAESDWGTLEVSVPKNKAININSLFLRFLENHPHLFPLIRQIFGLQ